MRSLYAEPPVPPAHAAQRCASPFGTRDLVRVASAASADASDSTLDERPCRCLDSLPWRTVGRCAALHASGLRRPPLRAWGGPDSSLPGPAPRVVRPMGEFPSPGGPWDPPGALGHPGPTMGPGDGMASAALFGRCGRSVPWPRPDRSPAGAPAARAPSPPPSAGVTPPAAPIGFSARDRLRWATFDGFRLRRLWRPAERHGAMGLPPTTTVATEFAKAIEGTSFGRNEEPRGRLARRRRLHVHRSGALRTAAADDDQLPLTPSGAFLATTSSTSAGPARSAAISPYYHAPSKYVPASAADRPARAVMCTALRG